MSYIPDEHEVMARQCLIALRSPEIIFQIFEVWEVEFWRHQRLSEKPVEAFGTSRAEIFKHYIRWHTAQAHYFAEPLREDNPLYFSERGVQHLRIHLKASRLTLEDVGLSEAKIQSLKLRHYEHLALITWSQLSQISRDLHEFTRLLIRLQDFTAKAHKTFGELGISEEQINQIRFHQL